MAFSEPPQQTEAPQQTEQQTQAPGTSEQQTQSQQVTDVNAEKVYDIKYDGGQKQIKESDLRKYYGVEPDYKMDEKKAAPFIKAYQLELDARAKHQSAAEMRKQSEAFYEALFKNPKEVLLHPELKKRGLDFEALAIDYLTEKFRREEMSPEQRRLAEIEEENRYLRDRDQRFSEREQREAYQQEVAQHENKFVHEISDALQRSTVLPKDAESARRIAFYIEQGINQGINVSALDAARLAEEDYQQMISNFIQTAPDETIKNFLGNEGFKKIQKMILAGHKDPNAAKPNGQPPQFQRQEPKKQLTPDEARALIKERARQLGNFGAMEA